MRIANKVETDLKTMPTPLGKPVEGCKFLKVVADKDMEDWATNNKLGVSENLNALANKISYMIQKGDAPNITRMLAKIVSGRIKKFTTKGKWTAKGNRGEFLGYGSFRFNWGVYTLNAAERERVADFFKLNFNKYGGK